MASKSLSYGNMTSHQIPSYPACISLARGTKVSWVGFLKIFQIGIYKFAPNKRFILFPRIGTQTKDQKFLETCSLIIFFYNFLFLEFQVSSIEVFEKL
jgi:hypothetical protein